MKVSETISKELRNIVGVTLVLLFFLGCSRSRSSMLVDPSSIDLFIEMPRSIDVFENVAPLVYDAVYSHFKRAAFNLVNPSAASFTLRSTITRFDTIEKLISPDVLPYDFRVWLDLECSLVRKDGTLVARKVFTFCSFASRPRIVRFTSHYASAEYSRVFNRFAPRIDHYFRKFFAQEMHAHGN